MQLGPCEQGLRLRVAPSNCLVRALMYPLTFVKIVLGSGVLSCLPPASRASRLLHQLYAHGSWMGKFRGHQQGPVRSLDKHPRETQAQVVTSSREGYRGRQPVQEHVGHWVRDKAESLYGPFASASHNNPVSIISLIPSRPIYKHVEFHRVLTVLTQQLHRPNHIYLDQVHRNVREGRCVANRISHHMLSR